MKISRKKEKKKLRENTKKGLVNDANGKWVPVDLTDKAHRNLVYGYNFKQKRSR